MRGMAAPALPVLLAAAISVLLAWISYLSDYWILARQWVGSVAMLLVSGQAINIHGVRLGELLGRLDAARARPMPQDCAPASLDARSMSIDERNDAMVELANRNITCGGRIWPVFRTYCRDQPGG